MKTKYVQNKRGQVLQLEQDQDGHWYQFGKRTVRFVESFCQEWHPRLERFVPSNSPKDDLVDPHGFSLEEFTNWDKLKNGIW